MRKMAGTTISVKERYFDAVGAIVVAVVGGAGKTLGNVEQTGESSRRRRGPWRPGR